MNSSLRSVSEFKNFKEDEYRLVLLNINDKTNLNVIKNEGISNVNELKDEGFIIHKNQEN